MAAAVKFTDDVVERLCDEIASGRAISDVSTEDWCPSQPTIYRRMSSDKEFAARISAARAAQQEFQADLCVQMADEATGEDWQVVKLRIWARQWRAAKLAPKKYGDKVTVGGDRDADPIKVEDVGSGAAKIAAMLARMADRSKEDESE